MTHSCLPLDLLEVAITGTAMPVDLTLLPSTTLDFGDCRVDHCTTREIEVCVCVCVASSFTPQASVEQQLTHH